MSVLGISLITGAVISLGVMGALANPVALPAIGNFVKTNWKLLGIMAICVACGVYTVHLRSVISSQQVTLAQDQATIRTLQNNNAQLESAVHQFNDAVNKFDKFAADTNQQFTILNTNVGKQNNALSAKLQSILKERKPQTCNEAIGYLIQHGSTK